jgi:hypothetical protein
MALDQNFATQEWTFKTNQNMWNDRERKLCTGYSKVIVTVNHHD